MYKLDYVNEWKSPSGHVEHIEVDSREKLGMIVLTFLEDHAEEYPKVRFFPTVEGTMLSITDHYEHKKKIILEWKKV